MHGHQSPNTTWNIKFLEAWLSGRLVPGEPKRTHLSGKSVSLSSTAWSWRQLVHVSPCTVVPILTPSHLTSSPPHPPHPHTLTLPHTTTHSGCEVSDEGRYMLMTVSRGAEPRNKFYYCDLTKLDGGKIQGTITYIWDPLCEAWLLSINIEFTIHKFKVQYAVRASDMLEYS